MEELFGEIEDEHDSVRLVDEVVGKGQYRFSARLEVDHINELHKLDLPKSENYETLGGLIMYYTEEIPQTGDLVSIAGYRMKFLEVSNTKIELVALQDPKVEQS